MAGEIEKQPDDLSRKQSDDLAQASDGEVFPPKQQSAAALQSRVQYRERTYSGPIPPPEMLAAYDHVLNGGAERIFKQFEEQSEYRRTMQTHVIKSKLRLEWAGLIVSSLLGITGLAGGLILAAFGKSTTGLSTFLATLIGLVTVFIIGRKEPDSSSKDVDDDDAPEEQAGDD